MLEVTLPDGSKRQYDAALSVAQIAESIGAGLAKAALAGRINGELVDLSTVVERDAEIAIITERDSDGLEVIRHSCAHLMAQAVQRLFPVAQVTIGPVIEDGFFYDFAFERPFTPEDLEAIEKAMGDIVKEGLEVHRSIMSRDEAVSMFRAMGEEYKVEIIESIPGDEDLSFYKQGDFIDLDESVGVRGFRRRARVARLRFDAQRAELNGLAHVGFKLDDAAGDLVEARKDRLLVDDLLCRRLGHHLVARLQGRGRRRSAARLLLARR